MLVVLHAAENGQRDQLAGLRRRRLQLGIWYPPHGCVKRIPPSLFEFRGSTIADLRLARIQLPGIHEVEGCPVMGVERVLCVAASAALGPIALPVWCL